MMSYEWAGFLLIVLFGIIISGGFFAPFFPRRLRTLILMAFLVRVVGVLLRHWVIYDFYEGGDATGYYQYGLYYANFVRKFDFSFLSLVHHQYGRWWGTAAITTLSSFVLSCTGPTQHGEFLVFSMLSLSGFLLFCKAFQRNFPGSDLRWYAQWILLWPSLWFWTCSVGKDSVILLATGLVVYGYSVKRSKIQWISVLLGVALASFIRPHVAGVMVVAMGIAHWTSPGARWTVLHWLQGVAIIVLAIFVIRYGFENLGVKDIDAENIKEYVELISARSTEGGSAVGAPGLTWTGIPLAFVNILFRPFPWEIRNPLMAAASLELIIFWYLIWRRRKRIARLAAQWRSNTLLRLSVPLILLYVFMLGVAVGNLGIIARQRIHVLPLFFIWLEALPQLTKAQRVRFLQRFSVHSLPQTVFPSGRVTGETGKS